VTEKRVGRPGGFEVFQQCQLLVRRHGELQDTWSNEVRFFSLPIAEVPTAEELAGFRRAILGAGSLRRRPGESNHQKLEYVFLEHTCRSLKPGGVLLFVIPQLRLTKCARLLSEQFTDLHVFPAH